MNKMNKLSYSEIINFIVIAIIAGIIIPLSIFWGVDRTVSANDLSAGYPLKGCIFSYNCNPANFN